MKKLLSAVLICAFLALCFSGCDRQSVDYISENDAAQSAADFAPEATAITSQMDTEASSAAENAANEMPISADPTVSDVAIDSENGDSVPTAEAVVDQPFATATPQPNTAVSGYSEISGTGLGFKFNYPTGWNNIPGRSTICYVQPIEDGTAYPARVAVTMKKLAHKCTEEKAQNELLEYCKLLMSQYDESTFEVSKELDSETKFMGNKAISTTYLAYDGTQEIQGYVIMTWFEKYVFCYHFLSAYEDYAAFDSTMRHMRDSVQAVEDDIAS